MNGSDLRAIFLDGAVDVVKSVTQSALGHEDPILSNPGMDAPSYIRTWELARDIISSSTDIVKIEMRTTEGIIKAVCDGKINTKEADYLMSLMQKKQTIDELPALLEAIQEHEANE